MKTLELPEYVSATPPKAVTIWVFDRFNEGEWQDFKKGDLQGVELNSEAYTSLELAKAAVEGMIRQEWEEAYEDDMVELQAAKDWVPEWTDNGQVAGGFQDQHTLDAEFDGSVYTIRAIPLHWA